MTTYYVADSGNDNNSGTASLPWRTIQKGVDQNILVGGDIVVVQGTINFQGGNGAVVGSPLYLVNKKMPGASGLNPVTIKGSPGNIINCSTGIQGYGSCRYWVFDGLNIRTNQADSTDAQTYGVGVYVAGDRTDKSHAGVTADGLGADYITIKNCTVDVMSTGWVPYYGLAVWGGDHITITDNVVKRATQHVIDGGGSAIAVGAPRSMSSESGIHVRIERNLVATVGPGDQLGGTDRNGIVLDDYHSSGTVGSYPLHADGRPVLIGDTLVANNIVMDVSGRGIHIQKGGYSESRIALINNTVIGPFCKDKSTGGLGGSYPKGGISSHGGGFANSITMFNNLVIDGNLTPVANYHLTAHPSGALAGSRNWTYNGGYDTENLPTTAMGIVGFAHPNLVSPTLNGNGNYRLNTGSPLIGQGVTSFNGWSAPTNDYYGQLRTGTISIGAAETPTTSNLPVANFTFPSPWVQGSAVSFTNISTNTLSQTWDFGDGTSSTLQNPTHIYVTAGTFQVQLTVVNSAGVHSVIKPIVISPVPIVGGPIISSSNPGFNGTGYVTNFGQIGDYVRFNILVTVPGLAALKFRYRSVAPQLRTIKVNNVNIATNVTLPATAILFTDNSWSEYIVNATLISGANTIEMRVDSGVDQFIDLDQVAIVDVASSGAAPVANFTFTPTNQTTGSQVLFTDTSTNSPTTRAWEFGDGGTSSIANPSHIFATAGTYQVKLTVTNPYGTNSMTRSVTISAVPSTGGGGGAVNFLNLFKSTYPSNVSKVLYVDGNTGNDSNIGSTTSPLRTIQAAVNQASGGTDIIVRAATYSSGLNVTCAGASNNWVRIMADAGAKIGRVEGSGVQPVSTGIYFGGGSYVAIYGFDIQGSQDIESASGFSDGKFDTGVRLINGNNVAIWKCNMYQLGSHAISVTGNQGDFGCADFFYNILRDTSNWDPYSGSAISIIHPVNRGTPASDGFHFRLIGNIIWNANQNVGANTDGNAIIFDLWNGRGFTGKGLVAFNLTVGCGGRGIHTLDANNAEFYFNTSVDNVHELTGTWDGEISFQYGSNCIAKYNIGAARVGRNRVGLNQGNHDWSQNLFLRGTGGSEANDPSPGSSNSLDKTSVGPANYFVSYTQNTVVNASDWRPRDAQASTIAPSSGVRTLLSPWPDFYGFMRGTGAWAYGAFESPANANNGGSTTTPPVADFSVSPTSPVRGTTAFFTDLSTNAPTSWLWDFGDGTTSTVQNPSKLFTASSTVIYQAENGTLTGSNFPVDPLSVHVITDNPGYSGTGYIGYWGSVGQGVTFTVNAPSSGQATLRFRYRSIGAQLRTVTVNGTAVVTNASLPATATAWTQDSWSEYVVQATLASGNNTVIMRIDSGVQQFIDLDQLSVVYASGGSNVQTTAVVSLTATNAGGSSVSQKTITVVPSGGTQVPVANFTASTLTPAVNVSVLFSDTSTNNPTSWLWNFGDGTTSFLQNPTKSWTTAGAKTVQLTATNSTGSNSISRTVTVAAPTGQPPVANFTNSTSPTQNSPIQFIDTSTGSPTSWLWNFGDNTTSIVQHPSHIYTSAGTFTVAFTANNAGGASSISRNIIVAAAPTNLAPVADFIWSPLNPAAGQTVTFTSTATGNPTSWSWDFTGTGSVGVNVFIYVPAGALAAAPAYDYYAMATGVGTNNILDTNNLPLMDENNQIILDETLPLPPPPPPTNSILDENGVAILDESSVVVAEDGISTSFNIIDSSNQTLTDNYGQPITDSNDVEVTSPALNTVLDMAGGVVTDQAGDVVTDDEAPGSTVLDETSSAVLDHNGEPVLGLTGADPLGVADEVGGLITDETGVQVTDG